MKEKILSEARQQLDEIKELENEFSSYGVNVEDNVENKEGKENRKTPKKKKRNQKIFINYFNAMDDIIADSYEKQKAAYEVTRAVTQLFEARGQNVPFDEVRFERAAQNMSICQMMREMSWLFGLSPAHTDRIVDHTIDRLFGNPKVATPPTGSNYIHNDNPYKRKK